MNIYIFGHSIVRFRSPTQDVPQFTDILSKKYNIPRTNIIQADCISQERILFFLKKLKNVDLVIIFYGPSDSVFVPVVDRDFAPITDPNLWEEKLSTMDYYKNRLRDNITNNQLEHITQDEIKLGYNSYINFFHTRDTTINRNAGALIQIDQYLGYKNIPAIHCPLPTTMPVWFKFTNGIVDTELGNSQNGQYGCSIDRSSNRVNSIGNRHIADKLSSYIDELVRRKGIEPL